MKFTELSSTPISLAISADLLITSGLRRKPLGELKRTVRIRLTGTPQLSKNSKLGNTFFAKFAGKNLGFIRTTLSTSSSDPNNRFNSASDGTMLAFKLKHKISG